jgi:hypothetical protein
VVPAPPEKPSRSTSHTVARADLWLYSFADKMATVRDFTLTVNTDFAGYNFRRTRSRPPRRPRRRRAHSSVALRESQADFDVGVELPRKLNPGPAREPDELSPRSRCSLHGPGRARRRARHQPTRYYFFLGASSSRVPPAVPYLVDHLRSSYRDRGSRVDGGDQLRVAGDGRRFAIRQASVS